MRATALLDRQFLASLRLYGVMDPIHVTRAGDGTLTVKRGQRRTLGAIKAGLNTVPVLVVGDGVRERLPVSGGVLLHTFACRVAKLT